MEEEAQRRYLTPMIGDKAGRVALIILEVTVIVLYVVFHFVDLSFLDLYQTLVGYVFGWMVVLLFIASLRMFSKHRLLAIVGLGIVAVIVVPSLIPPHLSPKRR